MIAVARWLRQRYRRVYISLDCFAPDGHRAVSIQWRKV